MSGTTFWRIAGLSYLQVCIISIRENERKTKKDKEESTARVEWIFERRCRLSVGIASAYKASRRFEVTNEAFPSDLTISCCSIYRFEQRIIPKRSQALPQEDKRTPKASSPLSWVLEISSVRPSVVRAIDANTKSGSPLSVIIL